MRLYLGDKIFTLIVTALIVLGTAVFLSASLGLLARQNTDIGHLAMTQLLLGLLPGIGILIGLQFIKTSFIQKIVIPIYIACLLLTAAVFIPQFGVHANGASRWIDIGPITVQPGEFLKIGVVLMFAAYLSKNRARLHDMKYGLLGYAAIVGLPAILLIAQPNTSTLLVLATTTALMYFVAGAPLRDFGILLVVALIGLGVLVALRPYLLQRITTFINPSHGALTSGYQIQQSLIAIGSGGVLGRGYGQSVQKFNYLPEAVDDAIFAVYAEEFGFFGTIILLLLFLGFATRGFMIASRSSTPFGTFAVTGLTLLVTISALLNIGAMLSIFPLTGLPLPFVSHGGTALLATLTTVGIILNIASRKNKAKASS